MLRYLDDLLRVLYVAAVFAVAVFLGFWAFFILAKIWAPDRDSSVQAYLVVGGTLGLAALALAVFVATALNGASALVRVSSVCLGASVAALTIAVLLP